MKLLKFLANKSGKISFSAAQWVGIGAAVGVAGLFTYQALSTREPDSAFSFNNNDDIVFVSNTSNIARYGRANVREEEGAEGRLRSAVQVHQSRDLALMNRDYEAAKAAGKTQDDLDRSEDSVSHKMATTSGLGMGANDFDISANPGQGDLSAIQARIDAMKAQTEAKIKQASQSATGNVAAAAADAMARSGTNNPFGQNANIATASGNNYAGMSLQQGASGGVLGGGSATRGGRTADQKDRLAMARSPKYEGGRETWSTAGNGDSRVVDLEEYRRKSAAVAANGSRSVNEASRAFMGGEKTSGLMFIDGNIPLDSLPSSSDYLQAPEVPTNALGGISSDIKSYEEASRDLKNDLRKLKNKAIGCSGLGFFGNRWCFKSTNDAMQKKIKNFRDQYGDSTFETTNTRGSLVDKVDAARKEIHGVLKKVWNLLPVVGFASAGGRIQWIYNKYSHSWGEDEQNPASEKETSVQKATQTSQDELPNTSTNKTFNKSSSHSFFTLDEDEITDKKR